MYLGSWKIDDYLTFTCNTHTPSTGAATDADSVPTYRVYEDETGTPITSGSTAKLDDAGTTGFYSERVQLLAATGFEKGKTYTVYISATVGGTTGTMSHSFQIEAEVDANVVSGSVPSVAGAVGSVTGNVGGNVTGTIGSLAAQAKLDVNAECDTSMTDYGANTTVPDVAGTAAGLHTTTDALVTTVDGVVDAILADTGTDGVLLAATATSAQLIDDVWDELLTGAAHNIATSAGRRLREASDTMVLRSEETAQGGAAGTITLAAAASAINDFYNKSTLIITDGTGVGQARTIKDYDGGTKVATACENWVTNPDATSKYVIRGHTCSSVYSFTADALAQINTECDTALTDYDPPTRTEATTDKDAIITEVNANETKIDIIDTNVDAVLVDTAVIGALGAGLTAIPWNSSWDAEVQSECADALTAYDPPTRTEATTDKEAIITEIDANETKIDALQTDSTAIKAKTDALPSGIAKNVALSGFNFFMVLSSDHVTPATGKTIAGTMSKDGAAFASLTNAVSEIASGMYKVDLTQAEMNADVVTLKFTETDCDQRIVTIYTS